MYFSHISNIKYIYSTIKYIGLESIHYTINLDIISLFMVFNDFDSKENNFIKIKLYFFFK